MKNKSREIPPRNYLICAIIFIALILTTLYVLEANKVKTEKRVSESYLLKTNTVSLTLNTIEELETTLLEAPDDVFLFTGYTGSTDEYELEKDMKNIIDEYNLSDNFYYLDVTNLMKTENELKNELSDILNADIKTLPIIIYISSNNVMNTVTGNKDSYLKASDFKKLLEINDFKKSN